MTERKAVTKQMLKRYEKGSKRQKGAILSELCALTGWSRDHARKALRRARFPALAPKPRRARTPVYDEDVVDALRRVWTIYSFPCGKRLAPFMAEAVEVLERFGELSIDRAIRRQLLAMSAATIDRRLAPIRVRLRLKGRHGTKPGSLLRSQIPMRTFAEWDEARPGFCECDLVSHDGGSQLAEHSWTLVLTCVVTAWTEMRALPNKAQRFVFDALIDMAGRLPFPLAGIDSDNGSEFINHELLRWCAENEITFTRTRPYRKNDNCFVEQKNWSVVRQAVGYHRYEGRVQVALLNELYERVRLFQNFFSPSMRLVEKTRSGARVRRRYDTPATPYRRLLASPVLTASSKRQLTKTYRSLNPAELQREIIALQNRLVESVRKAKSRPRKEVRTQPDTHPWKRSLVRPDPVRHRKTLSRT